MVAAARLVLINHDGGPEQVGKLFAAKMAANPSEPLYQQTFDILRSRFLDDNQLYGVEKDGPTSYALFIAPDDPEEQALAQQNAVSAISLFITAAELDTKS